MIPGEIMPATATSSSTPAREPSRLRRRQYRRPADPGRQPLPFLRDQPGAAFDRAQARGMRLDIPAGTAVRFEPGQSARSDAGALSRASRVVYGFRRQRHGRRC